MDPISRLQASIDQTRPIVAATTADDMTAATPCSGWDVQALANHLLGALVMFRDVATKGGADPAVFGADNVGDDLLGAYDRLGAETVDAWKVEGRVAGAANMPWGEMPAAVALQMLADDVLVHGWDLARATGQHVEWDQELAAETLAFAEVMFAAPDIRGDSFAAPLAAPDGADAMSRLVAFLGRSPDATPG
jgi:uncharacterized protein (TIGR03086 family)